MADAAVRVLGARVRGGLVVGAQGAWNVPSLDCIRGGHPVPSVESERAGRLALGLARSARPDELVLFLFSGGASALMAVPARGLTLEDKQRTTERLLRSGADIYTLNAVRKHLSAIKGGQLGVATSHSRTLAISDVPGEDLSVIASGPTVADASTFQEAVEAIRRWGGFEAFPERVVSHLARGAEGTLPETPKPHDGRLAFGAAAVVGSRHDAMQGASDAASARGYDVIRMEVAVVGEARVSAHTYLDKITGRMSARGPVARPTCVVSSGETTVRVTGCGRGGRNQEFALALVDRMGLLDPPVVLASLGTDGVDGPTDAAGAIVDSSSAARARESGLDPARFLGDNNAYAFFAAIGDLINTGPTGTNVGDLQVMLLT